MRRIIHEASLARFLVFVNQSSSVRKRRPDNFAIQIRTNVATRSVQCRGARLAVGQLLGSEPAVMAGLVPAIHVFGVLNTAGERREGKSFVA